MTDRKNKVFVRPMSIDDLSSVYHLGAKLFTAGTFPSLYRTWDEFELVGFFESDWDTCFVATDDEEAVALLLAHESSANRRNLGSSDRRDHHGAGHPRNRTRLAACRRAGRGREGRAEPQWSRRASMSSFLRIDE